jgi:hypothetical protein
MAKTCLFKFKDGAREIKVGDSVYLYRIDRRTNSFFACEANVVVKIGSKYIEIGLADDSFGRSIKQFEILTGTFKSQFSPTFHLYSSREAFQEMLEQSSIIREVEQFFRNGFGSKITFDQAKKIKAILDGV